MINTVLFLQAEKKCSTPCLLKAGDMQVEQEGGAKSMWGTTCAEPSAGPSRPCPMVIRGEAVIKKSLKDGCETNIQKIEKRKKSSSWIGQGMVKGWQLGCCPRAYHRWRATQAAQQVLASCAGTATSLPLSWAGADICTLSSQRAIACQRSVAATNGGIA